MPRPWEQYQQPAQPATPAAPTAGPWTQYQQPAATPAPTQPQPQSWWDRLRTSAGSQTPQQMTQQPTALEGATGLVKSGVATAAGLANLINKYDQADLGEEVVPQFSAMTRKALEWAQPKTDAEREGFLAGNLGQLFAGAGPFEDVLQGLPMYERLTEAMKTAKAMGGDSVLGRLARIGMSTVSDATTTAARGAAEVGGQTYVQTGDIQKAREAAVPAAVGGLILGGFGGAGGQVNREAADWATAQRAGTQEIAGVPFATRPRTQIRPGQPQLLLRNLTEVSQDPATQAVDAAMGNIGKTAVANSMNAANKARAPEAVVIPPSRQLPGTAGYTVQGTPAVETVVQPSQEGSRVYSVSRPEGEPPAEQWVTSPNFQDIPPPTGGGSVTRGGGGPVILTADGQGNTVARARQQLQTYQNILNDPAQVEQLGPQATQRIANAHADLSEQLRRYDDFAASQPHFAPFDVKGAVANTDSLGDAATHLKDNASQFWTTADSAAQAAGDSETWTGLRNEEKNIKARMNASQPSARWDELRGELADVHQRQFNFMDRYRTQFSPQEWEAHRRMFQEGATLDDLNSLIQKNFNGITREEAGRNVGQRVFEPGQFTKQLEDFYNGGYRGSGTNRAVLENTIGQAHMDDLKTLSQLWDRSERMEDTGKLSSAIVSTIRRHYTRPGLLWTEMPAGAAAATLATGHVLGGVLGLGAPAAAGTIAGTRRYVLDRLATDPRFMRDFVYAVQNNVSPRVGGAILASRLIGTTQEPQGRLPAPPAPAAPAPAPATPAPAPAAATPAPLRATKPPDSISFTYQGAQFYRDSSGNFYDSQGSPLQSDYMTRDQQSAMDRAANAQTGGR